MEFDLMLNLYLFLLLSIVVFIPLLDHIKPIDSLFYCSLVPFVYAFVVLFLLTEYANLLEYALLALF